MDQDQKLFSQSHFTIDSPNCHKPFGCPLCSHLSKQHTIYPIAPTTNQRLSFTPFLQAICWHVPYTLTSNCIITPTLYLSPSHFHFSPGLMEKPLNLSQFPLQACILNIFHIAERTVFLKYKSDYSIPYSKLFISPNLQKTHHDLAPGFLFSSTLPLFLCSSGIELLSFS